MVCHFVVIAHGFGPFTPWGTATQGLQLLQTSLAHEKYLDEARARVQELEREIDALVLERRNPSLTPTREAATDAAAHVANSRGWFGRLWKG